MTEPCFTLLIDSADRRILMDFLETPSENLSLCRIDSIVFSYGDMPDLMETPGNDLSLNLLSRGRDLFRARSTRARSVCDRGLYSGSGGARTDLFDNV